MTVFVFLAGLLVGAALVMGVVVRWATRPAGHHAPAPTRTWTQRVRYRHAGRAQPLWREVD